jgi:hypothetical protein
LAAFPRCPVAPFRVAQCKQYGSLAASILRQFRHSQLPSARVGTGCVGVGVVLPAVGRDDDDAYGVVLLDTAWGTGCCRDRGALYGLLPRERGALYGLLPCTNWCLLRLTSTVSELLPLRFIFLNLLSNETSSTYGTTFFMDSSSLGEKLLLPPLPRRLELLLGAGSESAALILLPLPRRFTTGMFCSDSLSLLLRLMVLVTLPLLCARNSEDDAALGDCRDIDAGGRRLLDALLAEPFSGSRGDVLVATPVPPTASPIVLVLLVLPALFAREDRSSSSARAAMT